MAKRSPLSEIVEGISAVASLTTAAERLVEKLAARALRPGPEDAAPSPVRGPDVAPPPPSRRRARLPKVSIEVADPPSEGLRVSFRVRKGHVAATWGWDEFVALLGPEGISELQAAIDRYADEGDPDEHEGAYHEHFRLVERP